MYRTRSDDPYSDLALGLISAQSFPAIVGIADMMLKSSAVTLVGYEQIGSGYCTAVVRGRTSDIRLAIQTGEELAAQFGQKTSSAIIPRPMPNLEEVLPIGSRLAELVEGRENNRFRDQAVGLIETRGFPALVAAADAMLKSADVTFSAYHTTGAGLCTAIVRGSMSNVAAAIEIGMVEADRVGELHAVMVIPRPLEDLERTMPIAACWIEELQPVRMPINITVEEQVRELQPLQPLELPQEIPAVFNEEVFEPQKLEIEQPLEEIRMPDTAAQEPLQAFSTEPLDRELDAPLDSLESPIEPTQTQPPFAEPVSELHSEAEVATVEVMPVESAEMNPESINPSIEPTTPSSPSVSSLPAVDAIAVEVSSGEAIESDFPQLAPEAVSEVPVVESVPVELAPIGTDSSPAAQPQDSVEITLEATAETAADTTVEVLSEPATIVEVQVTAVEATVEVVESGAIDPPATVIASIEAPVTETVSEQNSPVIATNSAEPVNTAPEVTPSQPKSQPDSEVSRPGEPDSLNNEKSISQPGEESAESAEPQP
ncbi:BMC domain-containing protein [Alkalinema pantanalense CENA528]|uniref:carbon dioxide-concentrating mechanism protein CcmK n=1 Tax=Alkalinema pantanalense TaxID=1620705 RepID=UPI003D6F2940